MYCASVHPSHNACNFTFFPFYPDRDSLFGAHNEKKICQIILVSKNNEYVVLSSEKTSFGLDNTLFPNAMRIMAENKTELSDFN